MSAITIYRKMKSGVTALPLIFLALAALGGAAEPDAKNEGPATAAKQILVEVNGRPLTGPFSAAERRSGKIFVPVAAIARALGSTVTVRTDQLVSVRRTSRVETELDLRLMQIRENGAIVLTFSDVSGVAISRDAAQLMLPGEWASVLLGVDIHFDTPVQVVRVTDTSPPVLGSRIGADRGRFELFNAEYEYVMNSYSGSLFHDLRMRATGRIGNGRFSLNTSGGSGGNTYLGPLRSGTFDYEHVSGRRFAVGDVSSGSSLQFLSTSLRGAWAQAPFKGAVVSAFGGRVASGDIVLPSLDVPVLIAPAGRRFDTTVIGASAGFGNFGGLGSTRQGWGMAAGGMNFSGAGRSGQMASAAFNYGSSGRRIQADAAFGSFRGRQADGRSVDGAGFAADVTGSYDLTESLTVQGRFTHISKNFLTPAASQFIPVSQVSAGISWSPLRGLSTSFFGSTATRPGERGSDRTLVASANIDRGGRMPSVYMSHSTFRSEKLGNSAYSIVNVSKQFEGFRVYLNASRVQNTAITANNFQAGAAIRLNEGNSLLVSQSVGSRGYLNGLAEWSASSSFSRRLSFTAGVGYTRSRNHLYLVQKGTASIRLPRETSLLVSYFNTAGGSQLQVTLRGMLFSSRSAAFAENTPVSELKEFGVASGRVYQDVNLNGKYDPGSDVPQANVRIRVDGNLYATTDQNGMYRIENVRSGEHEAYIDLLSVRADLTILDNPRHQLVLAAGRDATLDFRLVRTGRIAGLIWYDENENGIRDGAERTVEDVRVVLGAGRDGLSDENGVFTIGDLPPGEHTISIDEKTLLAGQRVDRTYTVKVTAGKASGPVMIAIIPVASVVKVF